MQSVPFRVALQLGQPPFTSVCGCGAVFAAPVAVPEAAMHKDNGFVFREDNVGFSGKFFAVEAEAKAEAMQE